jgi:hypothetical protein
LVSGVSLNTSTAWDCTSSNWQEHWTNESETYCINDFDQAISTIPAGAVVTDPATVAAAWGRGVSNIAGRVTTGSNQPVAAATVAWSGGSTTTDTGGYYTLSSVAVGTDSVTVNAAGYAMASAAVNVSSGNTTLQNFTLGSASTGAMSGTVTDASTKSAISGATVSYSGGSTTTNPSGVYTLSNVVPGTYTVTASATGYMSGSASVPVTAGTSTTQNFALPSVTHQPIFSDGFESGNFSAWTKSKGLVVENTAVHAGTYAAEGNLNNTSGYAQKLLPSTYASGYERVWFNIVNQASQINLLRARTAAGGNLAFVFVDATRHDLDLNVLGTKVRSSTTAVLQGSGWHELEMYAALNGATSSVQVWLDGTQVNSLTWRGSLGSTPIGAIQIGEVSNQTWNVAFDDVAFDTQFLP